eukprot:g28371.t1
MKDQVWFGENDYINYDLSDMKRKIRGKMTSPTKQREELIKWQRQSKEEITANIIIVFKKGDKVDYGNYCEISLHSIAGKKVVWKFLSTASCPVKFINILHLFHDTMSAMVLTNGNVIESTEVKTGVKQGCVITPFLHLHHCYSFPCKEQLPSGVDIVYRMERKLFNPNLLKSKKKTTPVSLTKL